MAVGPQHASSPPDRLLGGQLVASRRRLSRSGRFRSWLTGRGQLPCESHRSRLRRATPHRRRL